MAIPSWLQISQASGSGDTIITITASTYSELIDRTTSLVVSGQTKSVEVPVIQYGVSLFVSPTSINLSWNGGYIAFLIDTTEHWEITNIPSWVTLSATSGTGTSTVRVSASANTSATSTKSGTMTVTLTNFPTLTQNVTVTQNHAPAGNAVLTYTTRSGNMLTGLTNTYFSANIYSHTYTNGVGKIVFDGPLFSINARAFSVSRNANNADLNTIVIPNTVVELKESAFYHCSGLTSVQLSSALTTIGASVFNNCGNITDGTGQGWNLQLPEGVNSIGSYAFYSTSLRSISGSSSYQVINLGSHAFDNCRTLSTIDFYLGSVPAYAIYNNGVTISGVTYGVRTLHIADTVTDIPLYAISCQNLESVYVHARTAPTVYSSVGAVTTSYSISTGYAQPEYHYPIGSDYSSWENTLASKWTGVADL